MNTAIDTHLKEKYTNHDVIFRLMILELSIGLINQSELYCLSPNYFV